MTLHEEIKEVAHTIRQHPNVLVLYFACRLLVFGLVIGFFGVEFKVDIIEHIHQHSVALYILFPLALLGVLSWWKRSYILSRIFVIGFLFWNLFLIWLFVNHDAYTYVGLYAFIVDAAFACVALYLLRLRKLKYNILKGY